MHFWCLAWSKRAFLEWSWLVYMTRWIWTNCKTFSAEILAKPKSRMKLKWCICMSSDLVTCPHGHNGSSSVCHQTHWTCWCIVVNSLFFAPGKQVTLHNNCLCRRQFCSQSGDCVTFFIPKTDSIFDEYKLYRLGWPLQFMSKHGSLFSGSRDPWFWVVQSQLFSFALSNLNMCFYDLCSKLQRCLLYDHQTWFFPDKPMTSGACAGRDGVRFCRVGNRCWLFSYLQPFHRLLGFRLKSWIHCWAVVSAETTCLFFKTVIGMHYSEMLSKLDIEQIQFQKWTQFLLYILIGRKHNMRCVADVSSTINV